jgi:hypothetical protein
MTLFEKVKINFLEFWNFVEIFFLFSSCRVMQNLLNLTMEVMVVPSVSKKFLTKGISRDIL